MAKRKKDSPQAQEQAQQLQTMIRSRGDYEHIRVRPRAGHLVIECEEKLGTHPVARLTPLGGGQFGLSYCNHTGKWEPMPFSGPMPQVVEDMISALAPYLARYDL